MRVRFPPPALKQIPDGERRSAGMNSTVGPGRVQNLFFYLAPWLNGLQCRLVTPCGAGSNPVGAAKPSAGKRSDGNRIESTGMGSGMNE